MIRRALFYLNKSKISAAEIVGHAVELCREREIEPVFFDEDASWLGEHMPRLLRGASFVDHPVPGQIDLILVFGGDGTMLRALDSYVSCNIPMLGVNLGRMGFLLETQPEELADALDRIKAGKYEIERRMMLRVEGYCSGKPIYAHATNEVSISRGLSQRMIALDAYVGDMLVDHYIADGLVLSSPTGSTAYSLSAFSRTL